MTGDVIVETAGAIGRIVLDRPKALNALTLPMIRAIAPALAGWAKDPAIRAVVIRGAGDRAFCAGGDVRAVWDAGRNGRDGSPDHPTRAFFREEYQLNRTIHRFPKPFVAFLDGITMGGGVGLSVHGSHRLVTEKTMVAMPETGIGLFPDVGGSWFMPRCPERTGIYLALTGARIKAADAVRTGFGTHYVPSNALDGIEAALRSGADADAAISAVSTDPGPTPITEHRQTIIDCFGHQTVEAIMAALEADGSAFAQETLGTLRHKSPTSLKIVLEEMIRGLAMSIEEALVMEYRMVQGCMDGHDFFEGIRAVLVDKDHAPKWRPDRLEQVDRGLVDRHFARPPEGDLAFT